MFARLVLAAAVAGALMFAGCGGGGDGEGADGGDERDSSGEATRTPRPTRTPKPADPRDSVQLPEDACDLLEEDEVLAFSDQLKPTDPLGGDPDVWKGCQWQYKAGGDWGTLSVEVRKFYTGETAEEVKARLEENLSFDTYERIDGVGHAALLHTFPGAQIEATALLENLVITVGWTNPEPEGKKDLLIDKLKAVAARVE